MLILRELWWLSEVRLNDPADTRAAPVRIALQGVLANAILGVVKLLTGIFGNSFALIADAIESLVDIFASLLVWGAFRYGEKPADDDHPLGHGKVEALGGLAVGLLILGAAVGIAWHAIHEIRTPHAPPELFTLPVLVVVILVKEILHRKAKVAATHAHSSAGHADAGHHRLDSLTSFVVLIGILLGVLLGPAWHDADDWGALVASLVIAWNGFVILKLPFAELMDRAEPEVAARAATVASHLPKVLGIGRTNARRSGRGYRVVLDLLVDRDLSVGDAHDLANLAERQILATHPEISAALVRCLPAPRPQNPA